MDEKVRFIHNSEIDLQRWDQVTSQAPNTRIYALSWYLDILHPDWYGLIVDDYRYLMPVIFSKKWGIEYAFQPLFAQQHGIFPPSPPETTLLFLEFLKKRFRYFDLSFNSLNLIKDQKLTITEYRNFLLSLSNPYEETKQHYSTNCLRNIRKGKPLNTVLKKVQPDEYLDFKQKYSKVPLYHPGQKTLRLILHHSLERNTGTIYGVYSMQNQLTGAAVFLQNRQRHIYLNSVSSPEGIENRSMYTLLDTFIRDHSGIGGILDFEGSNLPGVARFFAGFGARPEVYYHLVYNRLPWPIKLVKKK